MSMNARELTVKVVRKCPEATDIATFELADSMGRQLPMFSAGSHIDVLTPSGLVRQYSLCNDPRETHRYLIGVHKAPSSRGGSQSMHDGVKEGDELRISGPKNHFALSPNAESSVLIAGGIGITPILCMAERLAVTGADFRLHYVARSRSHMAFRERIETSDLIDRARFYCHDEPEGERFYVDAVVGAPVAGVHLYVCGPKRLIDAVLSRAREQQWPESQLHYEFFTAEPTKQDSDQSFEVKLASSGRIVTVAPDVSITDALRSAGVEVLTSCEQGICGTCITRVLEGEPDHRDLYLTPEEQAANDQLTPCCSRAKSRVLVLDL